MTQINDDRERLVLRRRNGDLAGIALANPGDLDRLGRDGWCLATGGYVVRKVKGENRVEYLHREIFGLRKGDSRQVDHISRNKLDNRRGNLRIVPRGAQPQNTSSHSDSTSRFRGVSRRGSIWRAQVGGVYLGAFNREEDAAAAAAQYRQQNLRFAVEDDPYEIGDPNRRRFKVDLGWSGATQIRIALATTTLSERAIADMFGVGPSTVHCISRGDTWKLERLLAA